MLLYVQVWSLFANPQTLAVVWMVKILHVRTISAQILENRTELSHRLHLYLRNGSTARSFFFFDLLLHHPCHPHWKFALSNAVSENLVKNMHTSFHLTQLKRSATSGNTRAFRNVKETKKVNRESCAATKHTHKKKKERAEWEEGKRGSTIMLLRSNL